MTGGLATGIAAKAALGGALNEAKRIGSWFFLHPAWLVTAAACLFGVLQMQESHHWKKRDAGHVAAFKQEQAAFASEKKSFAIEKASLDAARAQIDENNQRIAAAHTELDREKAQVASDEARNTKLARSTDAKIAAVKASVSAHPPCVVPDAAKKALDDL